MVSYLNIKLKNIGFQGIGPISKTGLPIYLGRYYDEKTNRIKTIGPPSRNINMTDWKTKMNYLIQHAAYKWNQYARA